jgi:hypothetical protein
MVHVKLERRLHTLIVQCAILLCCVANVNRYMFNEILSPDARKPSDIRTVYVDIYCARSSPIESVLYTCTVSCTVSRLLGML